MTDKDKRKTATAKTEAPATPDEQVDEDSEDSFPASDPPSFSPGIAGKPKRNRKAGKK